MIFKIYVIFVDLFVVITCVVRIRVAIVFFVISYVFDDLCHHMCSDYRNCRCV